MGRAQHRDCSQGEKSPPPQAGGVPNLPASRIEEQPIPVTLFVHTSSEQHLVSTKQRPDANLPQEISNLISTAKHSQSRQRFADLRSCCGHRFPLSDIEVRTGNITSCEGPSECTSTGAKQSPAAPTCKGGRGITLRQSTADPSTPTSVTLTQLFTDVTAQPLLLAHREGKSEQRKPQSNIQLL